MQDDCPKPTTDPVEACDELPADYGLRRDRPVEWGLGGGQPPYYERLLCPDGSQAKMIGRAEAGAASASESPISAVGSFRFRNGVSERIERWAMRCGDEIHTFYSNMYRCGSHCAPKPFALLPAAAHEAVERSRVLNGQQRYREAQEEVLKAFAIYPDAQDIHQRLVLSYLMLDDYHGALAAAEQAASRFPESFTLHLRVTVLLGMGRHAEAEKRIDELIALTQDEHGNLRCEKSYALEGQGRVKEMFAAREEACAAGAQHCCDSEPVAEQ